MAALSLVQIAQSACQSTAAVRGGEQSRATFSLAPALLLLRRAAAAHQRKGDVKQHPAALRRTWSKDSCLSDCLRRMFLSVIYMRVHGSCMVGQALWCATMGSGVGHG